MFRTLAVAAALLSTPVLANNFRAGDLTIAQPYSFEIPRSARSAVGYFSVTNEGDVPDRLLAVLPEKAMAGYSMQPIIWGR